MSKTGKLNLAVVIFISCLLGFLAYGGITHQPHQMHAASCSE